jgi:hypothetical protein
MQSNRKTPPYMRRYMVRVFACLAAYGVILTSSLTLARSDDPPGQAALVALALLSALPIIGVFWAVFRLLVEADDEYQRLLFAKQVLLATAITLALVTVWQFLDVFDVVATGPQWMGAIWFAMLGIAGGIVRWKA